MSTHLKVDFVGFLQTELSSRLKKNPHYSLRAFARDLAISPGVLSLVLRGGRSLSENSFFKIGKKLGYAPRELSDQFFIRSIDENQNHFEQLSLDTFMVIKDWYHDAIIELTRTSHFNSDPIWISEKLGISKASAVEAIERLLRLKMLVKNAKGDLVEVTGDTSFATQITTSLAQKYYQRNLLEKSLETLQTVPRDQRDHSSMMFAINKDDLLEAKKKIKEFRREMNAFFQRKGRSLDDIYVMNVSLFPVSEIAPSSKEEKHA